MLAVHPYGSQQWEAQSVTESADQGQQLAKISGIGEDRPGIVFRIATTIAKHRGNILLQRSMQVAGEYAIVIVASFDAADANIDALRHDLGGNTIGENFVTLIRRVDLSSFNPPSADGKRYVITATGADRMGIVESVTLFLLKWNLNLDAMESEVSHFPFEGTPTFKSTFEVTIPPAFNMVAFTAALKEFERNSDLVIEIEPA